MRGWVEQLRPELDATGLPWRTETGKRHIKLYLCDRMILVLSNGTPKDGGSRDLKNSRATIRRFARNME